MLSVTANLVFVLILVVAVPIISFKNSPLFKKNVIPRFQVYLSSLFSQWALGLTAVCVASLRYEKLSMIGLRNLPPSLFFSVTIVLAIAILLTLAILIFFQFSGIIKNELEAVRQLLPETRKEKLTAIFLLSPSAGICEEFIYRGYLLKVFWEISHSEVTAWLLSSIVFGLAHSYQGYIGVLRASLLGFFLAFPVLYYESLYPSMLVHFGVDALTLAWVGPRFWSPKKRVGACPLNK